MTSGVHARRVEPHAFVASTARLGLGVLTLGLDVARPFDVGAGTPADEWVTHFTLSSPFLPL